MRPEKGPAKKHPCGRPLGFRRIIEVLVKQREPVTAREIFNCDPRLKSVSSVVGLILNHNDGAIIKIGQKNGPTLYTLSETERARWGVDMDERTGRRKL